MENQEKLTINIIHRGGSNSVLYSAMCRLFNNVDDNLGENALVQTTSTKFEYEYNKDNVKLIHRLVSLTHEVYRTKYLSLHYFTDVDNQYLVLCDSVIIDVTNNR